MVRSLSGRLLVQGGSSDFRAGPPEFARIILIKDFTFFGGFWGSKCPIFLGPPELPRPLGGTRSGGNNLCADVFWFPSVDIAGPIRVVKSGFARWVFR